MKINAVVRDLMRVRIGLDWIKDGVQCLNSVEIENFGVNKILDTKSNELTNSV